MIAELGTQRRRVERRDRGRRNPKRPPRPWTQGRQNVSPGQHGRDGHRRGDTHAERTLGRNEHEHAVGQARPLFQKAMEAGRTNADERLAGRKVIALVSGNHISLEIASECLILDGSLPLTTLGPLPPPRTARTIDGYAALRAGSFGTRT